MNEIEQRMTHVLRQHHRCNEAYPVRGKWHCAGCDTWVLDHDAHLAQTLAETLGLEPSWLIPTTRCSDGQSRGNITFESEQKALAYRDEWLPDSKLWVAYATNPQLVLDATM